MSTRRHFIQATATTTLLGSLGLQTARHKALSRSRSSTGFLRAAAPM